ncbi:hypothetical protein HGA91_00805 [candidate division WWE3 bacterium]|nr:hypothetical protein [candidate division WWE3 bacterium]
MDQKLKQLIDLAVIDDERKSRYIDALTVMNEEQKITFAVQLWQLLSDKMHLQFVEKAQNMIEEMAQEGAPLYTQEDFAKVEEQTVFEFLRKQSGLNDEDKLAQLRDELLSIQQMVESHDREISEIKNKIQY